MTRSVRTGNMPVKTIEKGAAHLSNVLAVLEANTATGLSARILRPYMATPEAYVFPLQQGEVISAAILQESIRRSFPQGVAFVNALVFNTACTRRLQIVAALEPLRERLMQSPNNTLTCTIVGRTYTLYYNGSLYSFGASEREKTVGDTMYMVYAIAFLLGINMLIVRNWRTVPQTT